MIPTILDNVGAIGRWWCGCEGQGRSLWWEERIVWKFRFFCNRKTGDVRPWRQEDENWRDDAWMKSHARGNPYVGSAKAGTDKEIDGVVFPVLNRIARAVIWAIRVLRYRVREQAY